MVRVAPFFDSQCSYTYTRNIYLRMCGTTHIDGAVQKHTHRLHKQIYSVECCNNICQFHIHSQDISSLVSNTVNVMHFIVAEK